jgi:hypothetical protein
VPRASEMWTQAHTQATRGEVHSHNSRIMGGGGDGGRRWWDDRAPSNLQSGRTCPQPHARRVLPRPARNHCVALQAGASAHAHTHSRTNSRTHARKRAHTTWLAPTCISEMAPAMAETSPRIFPKLSGLNLLRASRVRTRGHTRGWVTVRAPLPHTGARGRIFGRGTHNNGSRLPLAARGGAPTRMGR